MSSRERDHMSETRTTTSHYEVQNKRRADYLEYWKQNQRFLIRGEDVVMHDTPRGMRRGVMVSADGGVPSLNLDAVTHEIPPGVRSTVHRHSWDAILFMTEGSGWTEVDGKRHEWRPWDTVYLPGMSWHRHGNDGSKPAKFISWSVQPMVELLGLALLEDAGDTPSSELPPRPRTSESGLGNDPYSNRLRRLGEKGDEFEESRILTAYDDINFRVTPKGARSGFLVDKSIGHRTQGITAVMHQLAPGLYQSRHRHGGEAWLYGVSGEGYSVIDEERYDWGPGDLVVVDHWAWHQHFNRSNTDIASLVRVHNFDTLYQAMRALLAPLDLFEELPKLDAPDLTGVEWPDPDAGRPSA
jgi:gentisate 1,2-dioxygenase